MKKVNKKKPIISALEQRILFDGAAVATAVDVLDNSSFTASSNDATTNNDVTSNNAENSVHGAQATQSFERDRREVAFVDSSVEDFQTLVDGIKDGVEIFVFDGSKGGVDQITSILEKETNIDAIHILSHGSTGEITLGTDKLSSDTLDDYNEQLQIIKDSLSENGDILLYGCNVASDGSGQEFIEALANLTQADISASDDITGDSALGGDWNLEVSNGNIETNAINVNTFSGELGTPSITNLNNMTYIEQSPATVIDSNISITNGGSYDGKYIEFSISSAKSTESLTLTNAANVNASGAISFIGSSVYLGNGTSRDIIGSIDSTYNGLNGQNLRINFVSAFTNPSFETGNITGWTSMNQMINLGVTSIAGFVSQDTSTYSDNANSGGNDDDVPSATYNTTVSNTTTSSGSYSLQLTSSMTTANGYDVVHGPAVYSDVFEASAGDVIYFDWRAYAGGDDFDAFGYIVNTTTGAQIEVLDATGGSNTDWTTKATTISTAGTYRFVFVNGTYDASGGKAAGGTLYIDNVRVFGSKVNDSVVSTISSQIAYSNTSDNPDATRTYTVTAVDSNGLSSSASSTINITAVNDPLSMTITNNSTSHEFTETINMNHQALSQSGTISFNDVDNNVTISHTSNSITWSGGTLDSTLANTLINGFTTSITDGTHSGNGTWAYNVADVDLNFLSEGETITFSYTITAIAGSETITRTINFTITGTNDAPVFGTIVPTNPVIEAPTVGNTSPSAGIEVFNNGSLRFGNGSIDSVNASTGMLEQPFYYKDGTWYQLTFSTYQLNMAIAADYNNGSAKTDVDWNLEGTVNLTPTFTNTNVDNSGFNTATGTGTIVWTGEITVGTAHLKVTNVYTLNADSQFIKANTYIKNMGSTSTENLRFWVGTRDDFVAGSDSPAKQKGNIVDGEFTMISNATEQAKAIKVYTGTGSSATAVLFYSTNENVNTVIAPGYGWSTSNQYAPGIDPLNSVYNQSYDDGGYAMFTNLNNVAAGDTVMYDWYYAAGRVSELSNITSSLESATSDNLKESGNSLVLTDDYTITDLDLTDVVNVAVSSVVVTPPNGLTIPANYTNEIIKGMLNINSNPVIDGDSTTGTVSWSFNSGDDYSFNFLGAGQTLTLVYTLTATDGENATATTTVTISIDGRNDAPVITVDAGDSDLKNINETNSTLTTNGTLSITDVDIIDNAFTVTKTNVVASGMTTGLASNNNALLNMITVNTQGKDISWSFNSGNEYFKYLPAGETLTLTYTIKVTDTNNGTSNKTITIEIVGINDPVTLNSPATIYYMDTDGADNFATTSGRLTATDIDSGTSFIYGIDGATSNGDGTFTKIGTYGTLVINSVTGNYVYTPNSAVINSLSVSAAETFDMTVSDGSGSTNTKTLTIDIESVNDAPLLGGVTSTPTFIENGSAIQIDSTITVTDLEGTSYDSGYVTFSITQNKESEDKLSILNVGGISVNGTNVTYGGLIIGTIDSVYNGEQGKDLRINLNSNAYSPQVQALARAIAFSNPTDDLSGLSRGLEIKVNDGGNGDRTTARYSTKEVNVNIQTINDLPTINLGTNNFIVEKSISTNPNGELSLGALLSVGDLDGDTITVKIETTNYGLITINDSINHGVDSSQISGNGTRVVTITGTIDEINRTLAAANGITYVAGFGSDYITPGADYLKITATDDLSGVTTSQKLVMVLPAIPNIYSDNIVGAEDGNLIININDLVTDINDNGGTYVFGTGTPDITDVNGNITTAGTITPFHISTYIYDSNSKVIGYQLDNGQIILNDGKNRTDNADFAKFTFIPNENWSGSQTFFYQFTSNDGEVSNIAQVALFVTAVNDAPVVTVTNNITINEDNSIVFENANAITLSDIDVVDSTQKLDLTLRVENGKLELSQMTGLTILEGVNNSSSIKIQGNLTDLQNAISALKYTPNQDYNGSDSLIIKLNDRANVGSGNALETTQVVNISITAVNDAPEFSNQYDEVSEGDQISGVLPASDIDSNSITFSINGTAPVGFVLNSDGSYTFDSSSYDYITQGEIETIVISVTVTDTEGLTTTKNFSIAITGTNDAPTVSLVNIDAETSFGKEFSKEIKYLFSDKDLNDTFTFKANNLPKGLTIDPITGIISGRASESGRFVITIIGSDSGSPSLSVSRTFNMLVVAPPQAETKPTIDASPIPKGNNDTNGSPTTLNNYGGNDSNLGTLNYSTSEGFVESVGQGFLNTGAAEGNASNDGANDNRNSNPTNSANDGKGVIQANVDLNVLTNGQIAFNDTNKDSFSIVGITIEDIKVENNNIEIKVVDVNLAQNFIVTQIDGTPLPTGLFFDPKTGSISGAIPEGLEKLNISIKAISQDGTTRVLNLKLDLKDLQNKNQASSETQSFIGLKEQIAFENQKLEGYGSYVAGLFA